MEEQKVLKSVETVSEVDFWCSEHDLKGNSDVQAFFKLQIDKIVFCSIRGNVSLGGDYLEETNSMEGNT